MAITPYPTFTVSAGSPEAPAFHPHLNQVSPAKLLTEKLDDIRGRESEENVMNALRPLSIVESLIRHERYSNEDSNGTDITLLLREGFVRRAIRIQVKSRDGNMDKFYHAQDKKRIAENSLLSLDEYIAVQGFMVLNGRHEPEVIVEKFQTKLAFIQEVTGRMQKPLANKPVVVFQA